MNSLNAKLAHSESRLINTSRLCSSSKDVGLGGDVVRCRYSFRFVKEAGYG